PPLADSNRHENGDETETDVETESDKETEKEKLATSIVVQVSAPTTKESVQDIGLIQTLPFDIAAVDEDGLSNVQESITDALMKLEDCLEKMD
ncbi:hypothetical protein BGX26_008676, partial [Mortierella sp. AD094]